MVVRFMIAGAVLWGVALNAGLSAIAQEKPNTPEVLPVAPKPVPTLSDLPFPANQIVVVTDDVRKALEEMPVRWVLLSPELYRKLLQQAGQKATEEPAAQRLFTECHYRGLVSPIAEEGGRSVLQLTLQLVFITTRPEQLVELRLKPARLTRAILDGQTVRWTSAENTLALYVAQPGRHELHLETLVSITYDPTHRQYVATLEEVPPAVVTSLEVYVPGKVQSASVAEGGAIKVEHGQWDLKGIGLAQAGRWSGTRLHSEALGTLNTLELTWKPAEPAGSVPAGLLEGQLEVTWQERTVETEARLTLSVYHGQVSQLRLRVPPGSRQILWAEKDRSAWNAVRADGQGVVTVKLPTPLQAGSSSWTLFLRWQQPIPEKGPSRLSIGRLELLEPPDYQQTGWIEIRSPGNRAVTYAGNAVQIEAHRFRYSFQPVQLEMRWDEIGMLPPLLDVQAQHRVTVSENVITFQSEWQIARVLRANLQELSFTWPDGFDLDRLQLPPGVTVSGPQDGQVQVRLSSTGPMPRSLTFRGWFLHNKHETNESARRRHARQGNILLALPWLRDAVGEQTGQKVSLRARVLSATVQFDQGAYELALGPKTRGVVSPGGQHIYAPLRLPAELRWDSHQPEQNIVLELHFRRRLPQARWEGRLCLTRENLRLEQTIHLQFIGQAPPMLTLHLPTELRDRPRVLVRGISGPGTPAQPREDWLTLRELHQQHNNEPLQRFVDLPQHLGNACTLHIEYAAQLPDLSASPQTLTVPIVLPDQQEVDLQEGRLACWHSKDVSVSPRTTSTWHHHPTNSLASHLPPNWVLHTSACDAPVSLEIRSTASPLSYAQRMLVMVQPHLGQGKSLINAKYWLTQVGSGRMTIRLPTGASFIEVRVNGQATSPQTKTAASGQLLVELVVEPGYLAKPLLLEISYRVETFWAPFVQVVLPQCEPQIEVGRTRWVVIVEPAWRPVYVRTPATPEQPWTWHVEGWAFWNWWRFPVSPGPRQRFEQWLYGGKEAAVAEDHTAAGYVWQQFGSYDTMTVLVFRWHAWLLGCSLASVILGAVWLYGPRWLRWSSLSAALGLLAISACFSVWTFLALLAGAWPGILITGVLVLAIELQRWWWEKRLEWLAGFAPAPPGSTVQARPASSPVNQPRSAVQLPSGQPAQAPPSRSKAPGTQLPASPANQASP